MRVKESCSCGAVIEAHETGTMAVKEQIALFREAHADCRRAAAHPIRAVSGDIDPMRMIPGPTPGRYTTPNPHTHRGRTTSP